MRTNQQEQQGDRLPIQKRRETALPPRILIIIVSIFAIIIAMIWILGSLKIIPNSWASISSIIIAVVGAGFTILQTMHLFVPAQRHVSSEGSTQTNTQSYILTPLSLLPSPQISPIAGQLSPSDESSHRGIVGFPPPTDPRTIQQRQQTVRAVYSKLIQPDITAIVLTGIGGIGKSTLAALIYRYVEEQRRAHTHTFFAEILWLSVDSAVTFADLAGNLFEALGKPLPNLSNLAPQNQAVALFDALKTTDKPCLIILDQFENLLNWETGHALPDRPGVGEWLDMLNSDSCTCRILLTSRPWPQGTREYPPTYMQEYPVGGLEEGEGMELLQKQGVKGTEDELREEVKRCDGHAFALTLLASLLRTRNLSSGAFLRDPAYVELWTGNVAHNFLDSIYTEQLDAMQRGLLVAFSVYREPVPLEAAQAVMNLTAAMSKGQAGSALDVLLKQHLLQASEGLYQLHAIVASYAQSRFGESSERSNEETLRSGHLRAAKYYLQLAAINCPPREKRRAASDIHDLIEAIWHQCQAEQWQEAFELIVQEGILADLNRWGGYASLLVLCQQLLPLDKRYSDPSAGIYIYKNLGEAYRVLGRLDAAREAAEGAVNICKEIGDRKEEGWILITLGQISYDLGNKVRARDYYQQALQICRELGDSMGEGTAINYLGRVFDSWGQIEQALDCYEHALNIYRRLGDRAGEGWTLYSLCRIYDKQMFSPAQIEQALKCCVDALNILREVGDREKAGWALIYLGRAHRAAEQKEQALKCFEEALSIHREVGSRRGEAWTFHNLGRTYIELGDNDQAFTFYERALNVHREVGDRWSESGTLNNLGWLYVRLGELDLAREYYQQALSIRSELGDQRGIGRTLKNVGKVYRLWGKSEQATGYLVQALKIFRETVDYDGESRVLHDIGIIYSQRHQYDVALACFLLARNISVKVQNPFQAEVHSSIEKLQKEIGEDQFTALLASVEPRSSQIVNQASDEKM